MDSLIKNIREKAGFLTLLLFLSSLGLWLFLPPMAAYAKDNNDPVGWAIKKAKELADDYCGGWFTTYTPVTWRDVKEEIEDALELLTIAGKNKTVRSIKELIDGNDISLDKNMEELALYTHRLIGTEELYINPTDLPKEYLYKRFESEKITYYDKKRKRIELPGHLRLDLENELFKRIVDFAITLYHEDQHRFAKPPKNKDPKSEIEAHFAEFSLFRSLFMSALKRKDGIEVRYLHVLNNLMKGSIENMEKYYEKLSEEEKRLYNHHDLAKRTTNAIDEMLKGPTDTLKINVVKGVFDKSTTFPTKLKIIKWAVFGLQTEFRRNGKSKVFSDIERNLPADKHAKYLKAFKKKEKITFDASGNLLERIRSIEKEQYYNRLKRTFKGVKLDKFRIKAVTIYFNTNSLPFTAELPTHLSYGGVLFDEYQVTVEFSKKIKKLRFIYDGGPGIYGTVSATDIEEPGGGFPYPLQGAVVSVKIDGRTFSGTSFKNGEYKISIPEDVHLPDQLSITAKKKKFDTNTLMIKKDRFEKADIMLSSAEEKADTVSEVDLSGCWEDEKGRKITIRQEGSKVSADYPYFGRVFSGSLNKNKVTLLYTFKNVSDYASIPWVKYYAGNRPIPGKVLALALSKQRNHEYGFKLKITDEGELTGDFLNMHIQWDWDSGKLTDFRPEKDSAVWRRQKVKLKSVSFTDGAFNKRLSEIGAGERFWIKATVFSGCKGVADTAIVAVYPKGNKYQKVEVKLIETGPDTLELHSRRGFSPAVINAQPGETLLVSSGLKGASLKIKTASGRKGLFEKKKRLEEELRRIEDAITQRNIYPDVYGEGLRETLQKEKEHLDEEILQQMRSKNELLAQYPHSDTSAYDEDIKGFRERLKSVKEQLKDVNRKIDTDVKGLKDKKTELEKRLKVIIKKLKKRNR